MPLDFFTSKYVNSCEGQRKIKKFNADQEIFDGKRGEKLRNPSDSYDGFRYFSEQTAD